MAAHPIRLVVDDDLRRSRLTVFFRLLLAVPHFVWLLLWSLVALYVVAPITWLLTLILGRAPKPLWNFFSSLVRYTTHVYAFVFLTGNPFPGFTGAPGSYPIDVEFDAPERQNRWKTAFRALLVLPALYLASVLVVYAVPFGGYDERSDEEYAFWVLWGVTYVAASLGWWVCMVRGRMPTGFRDLQAYALRVGAQTWGYLLFVTDRYPDFDPNEPAATDPTPEKPVRIHVEDDLRRSRLTVFFRLLLALPHFVWLVLWGIAVFVTVIVGWFAALFTGHLPEAFHRFIAAYVRYEVHVFAFVGLVSNPFPGFTGTPGSYPVDLEIAPRERQNRWKTLFRLFLAIPASLLVGALNTAFELAAFFGWFVGLFLGRMPEGLRNLGAFVLRYNAQLHAYVYLLTDSYPYSGPTEYVEPAPELPPWPGPLRPPSLSQ